VDQYLMLLDLSTPLSRQPFRQWKCLDWMKNKHPEGKKGVPFAQIGVDREDRELKVAMTAPHSVSTYWRQLRDTRFYRGKWVSHHPVSRYVLVSGYEAGADKRSGRSARQVSSLLSTMPCGISRPTYSEIVTTALSSTSPAP
jgi:hypothetical protein